MEHTDFLKDRIKDYWAERADAFADQRMKEFESGRAKAWSDEINKHMPEGTCLRVLDIGTGSGFFAFIMAAEGHEATGIDITPEMIEKAESCSKALGLNVCFMVMDAERPAFENESFDVIVTRNLTWTLPHLDTAYKEWHRILAPGGVLINFDADYGKALDSYEEIELPKEHAHCGLSEDMTRRNDEITVEVYAHQDPRPEYDVRTLSEAGFSEIYIDNTVSERVYPKIDEFYNPVKMFKLVARKRK